MKQIFKFYSNGCGPCKAYAPVFDKIKNELQDGIEFLSIDIDNDPENLAIEYKVRGIPHTVLLIDGEVVKQQSGMMREDQLKSFILESTESK
jgi:thiol-disulfide isomerase/thioredoxin